MKTYQIVEWGVRPNGLYPDSSDQIALVYIKPDLSLIECLNTGKTLVPVSIDGTGSAYDGVKTVGTLVPSAHKSSYKPLPRGKPEGIAVLLDGEWYSYPLTTGTLTINIPATPTPDTPTPPPVVPVETPVDPVDDGEPDGFLRGFSWSNPRLVLTLLVVVLLSFILMKKLKATLSI